MGLTLVGELRSHMLCSTAKKYINKIKKLMIRIYPHVGSTGYKYRASGTVGSLTDTAPALALGSSREAKPDFFCLILWQ